MAPHHICLSQKQIDAQLSLIGSISSGFEVVLIETMKEILI